MLGRDRSVISGFYVLPIANEQWAMTNFKLRVTKSHFINPCTNCAQAQCPALLGLAHNSTFEN